MKQAFLVFCEGYTEECYIQELRQRYRSPIRIVPIRKGQAISNNFINHEINKEKVSPNDHIEAFLMYDRDVPEVNAKLDECAGTLICSNPSIELWFLLHFCNQKTSLNTTACIKALSNSADEWKQYKKSELSATQKSLLWENRAIAIKRAKALPEGKNPSSSVYKFLEAVEKSIT